MEKHKIKKFFMFLIFAPIAFLAFGYLFLWLWNWLIPSLFHGPVINFWQAIGLIALGKLLFGGFHGKAKCRCCKKESSWKRDEWKQRWENMPEEKKAKMKAYCKSWVCPDEDQATDSTKSQDNESAN